MSALEQEIIEKFQQLQPDAQQRLLALIEQEIALKSRQDKASHFDYATWLRDVETLREQIQASQGNMIPADDVVSILRDIRDGEDE
jgi:hypothetical protein